MQINVTLPLRWAQCWGYAIILMLVNLIVIFPLSAFLFQDFYSRMIPADSVQTIPFSESRKEMGNRSGNIKTTFQFDVERYSSDTAILPHVAANGFAQNVPLRADIPYNVNLDLNVFCLNKVTDLSVRDAEITISVSTSKKLAESVVFRKTLIFSCANTRDIPSLCENNRLSSTFANQVQKELVNSFHLDNPIFIEHDMKSLELSLKFAGNANLIVDPNTSLLTFSMNFEHSLRNLMVRWKKLAFVVGTLIFNALISFFFLLAFAISFFRAGRVGNKKTDYSFEKRE